LNFIKMALPRGDEYNQAVQNPGTSFSDSMLRACKAETTPLGLPKPYSGGFTTTYKLSNGHSSWAVRCFTREISDLQKRYKSIGRFISNANCDFLVEADHLSDGIKINGTFHPIIRMKWLDGDTLNNYLAKVHKRKATIENLISEFHSLVKKLENKGIAHGDLQHGNILAKNDKLYLIDYDGMYLPDISGLGASELGHPNFQHPKRTAKFYNDKIDRFSAIVIWLALKAMTLSPGLWKRYDNGDNILFKGQDFAHPVHSKLFNELLGFPELIRYVKNLIAICSWEFGKIPSLSEFLANSYAPSLIAGLPLTKVRNAYTVIDGSQKARLLECLGQRVEVVGEITAYRFGRTSFGLPYIFLNFGKYPNQTFTIVIWGKALGYLRKNNMNPMALAGKNVRVTGVLSSYAGTPQMTVEYANQIQMPDRQSKPDYKQPEISWIPETSVTKTLKKKSGLSKEDVLLNEIYKNWPVSKPVAAYTFTARTLQMAPMQCNATSTIQVPASNTVRNAAPRKLPPPGTGKKVKKYGYVWQIAGAVIGVIIGLILFRSVGGFIGGISLGFIIGSAIGT